MSDARSVVLGRVRAALTDVGAAEQDALERGGTPSTPGPGSPSVFAQRVEEYRATVTRCAAGAIADAIATIGQRQGARRLVVPVGLPRSWHPTGIELVVDDPPMALAELDRADGVLTGSQLAIAETGTIVLVGDAMCGRRAISLVPDLHICVVAERDVVATLPNGFKALAGAVEAGLPVTLISGPSANLGHRAESRRGCSRPAEVGGSAGGRSRVAITAPRLAAIT